MNDYNDYYNEGEGNYGENYGESYGENYGESYEENYDEYDENENTYEDDYGDDLALEDEEKQEYDYFEPDQYQLSYEAQERVEFVTVVSFDGVSSKLSNIYSRLHGTNKSKMEKAWITFDAVFKFFMKTLSLSSSDYANIKNRVEKDERFVNLNPICLACGWKLHKSNDKKETLKITFDSIPSGNQVDKRDIIRYSRYFETN